MNIYYVALAKQMLSFEKQWAGQWSQSVSQQAVNYLKQVMRYCIYILQCTCDHSCISHANVIGHLLILMLV
jgi:hypothetical protein